MPALAPRYARGNPARWWKTRRVGSAHRSPAAMFISPSRRVASLGLLIILTTLIAGIWYLTNPKRISSMADILLTNLLGADVEIGSGHLSFSGTLQLSGVQFKTNTGEQRMTLFSADQVEMRFDWLSLLSGRLRATQITAIRPTLYLIEDRATQRWNYERWERPASGGSSGGGGAESRPAVAVAPAAAVLPSLPVIVLREAKVQWAEIDHGKYTDTASTSVDAQLTPDADAPMLYRFRIDERAGAPSGLPGQLTGTWDVQEGKFDASASHVLLSDQLKHSMPRMVREWWDEHQLRGALADLSFHSHPRDGAVLTVNLDRVSMVQQLDEKSTGAKRAVTVPVTQVRGALVFTLNTGHLQVSRLRGDILGYPFELDGAFRGTRGEAPFELTLKLPNLTIADRYPDIFYAFHETADMVARLRPRGKFAVSIALRRDEWNGQVALNGVVECKDVKARFVHFPYPMEHLKGRVTFDNTTVRLEKLTAVADEGHVVITGSTGAVRENRLTDITVSSNDAVFDRRMALCLPERFLKVWEAFDPRGTGGFVCRFYRGPEPGSRETVHVVVTPTDARATLAAFPYPLTHVQGKFTIADEEATIDGITARVGEDESGEVAFSGKIYYPHGDVENLQPVVDIVAKNVSVEPALLMALPGERAKWAEAFDVGGRLAATAKLTMAEDAVKGMPKSPHIAGHVTLTGGRLADKARTWSLGDIAAEADFTPDRVELTRLSARTGPDGKAALALTATIDSSGPLPAASLQGTCTGLTLAPEPPAMLPPWAQATWKQYRPAGLVDADFAIKLGPPSANGPATVPAKVAASPADFGMALQDYTLHLRPRGLALTPEGWPDALTDLTGELTVDKHTLTFKNLAGRSGPITATTTGTYDLDADKLKAALTAKATSIPVKWVGLLPEGVSSFINSLKPEGTLTLKARSITRVPATLPPATVAAAGKPYRWEIDADASFATLQTAGPVPGAATGLTLAGTGFWHTGVPAANGTESDAGGGGGGGMDFAGTLSATDVTLKGHKLEALKAKLQTRTAALKPGATTAIAATATAPVDPPEPTPPSIPPSTSPATSPATAPAEATGKLLAITGIEAKVAGGNIQGNMVVRLGKNPRYEATLVLADADLAELVLGPPPPSAPAAVGTVPASAPSTWAEDRKRLGTGRVTANLAVQELFADNGAGDRTGRGELVVRDGKLYDVPLAMGLMQIVTLRLPVASSFNSASMSYYLRDDKVTFERILLESQGINLAGMGTMTLKDRHLDLRFVTESPHELYIPLLTPIFAAARNQLLQIQVTGPAEAPKIQPVPLDAVSTLLQALLPKPQGQ